MNAKQAGRPDLGNVVVAVSRIRKTRINIIPSPLRKKAFRGRGRKTKNQEICWIQNADPDFFIHPSSSIRTALPGLSPFPNTHTHTHTIKSALHNESQPGGFSIQLANHGRGALSTSILTDPCMEAVLAARTHSVVLSKPALSSEIKCWQGRSSPTRKIRDIELSRSILFARRSIWVTINAKEADARE